MERLRARSAVRGHTHLPGSVRGASDDPFYPLFLTFEDLRRPRAPPAANAAAAAATAAALWGPGVSPERSPKKIYR